MIPIFAAAMRYLGILIFVFFFSPVQAQKAAPEVYILQVEKLFDSETGRFLSWQEILVEGDRIAGVGKKVPRPKPAKVIRLERCTVTPGLIDAHTHLLFHPKHPDGMEVDSKLPAEERIRRGLRFAQENLETGITTVRDVGNSGQFLDIELRKRLGDRQVVGSRLYASGPIISPPGGQFGRLAPQDSVVIKQEYREVKGVEDARAAVNEHLRRGVDLIKVCMNTDNRTLAPEEIKAIVETAHAKGIPVTAHATYDESARDAVLAGVNGIEHGYSLKDSTLLLMAQKGVYLVPTDVSREIGRRLVVGKLGKEDDKMLNDFLTTSHDRLNRAHQKGVMIVSGSDFYTDIHTIPRGRGAVDVLLSYHEAGIPPQEVLRFATWNGAKALGRTGTLGVIKKGAKADLLIVNGDLENDFVRALLDVNMVIRDGRRHEVRK